MAGGVFAHLRVHIAHRDRFTCAEFVATAFAKAGVKPFPELEPQDIVPKDFARLLRRRTRR